jgi:hypothetical protein
MLNPLLFRHRKVLRKDIRFHNDHTTLHLRHSKTDRDNLGVFIPLPRIPGSLLCPVTALENLFAADPQPPEAPLFRFIDRGFPRQTVVLKIHEYLARANVDTTAITGHSIRQGAAQDAHDLGLPRDDIMVMGRWTSDSVDRYFKFGRSRQLKLGKQLLTRQLLPQKHVRFS